MWELCRVPERACLLTSAAAHWGGADGSALQSLLPADATTRLFELKLSLARPLPLARHHQQATDASIPRQATRRRAGSDTGYNTTCGSPFPRSSPCHDRSPTSTS